MNNALTQDDVSDMVAIEKGVYVVGAGHNYHRRLRVSELEDGGAKLAGLGLAAIESGHVSLTEPGHVELEERGV